MSTAAGSAPAPPVLPPQRLGRQWTGVTACPAMPCAGRLLAPWPPLLGRSSVLVSPVFTGPLDAKMEAGGAGEGEGGVAGWGLKHFEGVSGQVPRGLPCFMWPLMTPPSALSRVSGWAPTCPCPWATSLPASVPALRADPSLCPGKFGSSYRGAECGERGCAVLLVRLYHPALFVCVIIFVKTVLSVVATPLPQASGPICLPGRPAPHSAALGFPTSLQPGCQAS